jgi:hypothetical protein
MYVAAAHGLALLLHSSRRLPSFLLGTGREHHTDGDLIKTDTVPAAAPPSAVPVPSRQLSRWAMLCCVLWFYPLLATTVLGTVSCRGLDGPVKHEGETALGPGL